MTTCPSCRAPTAPSDFLCTRCERLLDGPWPSPSGAHGVVRYLLERPQPSAPNARPSPAPPAGDPHQAATEDFTVPVVRGTPLLVAGLSTLRLAEFDAWVASFIDGATDVQGIAAKAGVAGVEVALALTNLKALGLVEFLATPLPPALADFEVDVDLSSGAHPVLEDAPPTEQLPAMPLAPAAPSSRSAPQPSGGARANETDPRIVYWGHANRRVLDALKQVRRATSQAPSAPVRESGPSAGALQVAIRMEQAGQFDDAVAYLEAAINNAPDAAALANRLAIILMRERGDLRRAEQLLQRALELEPESDVYRYNLQMVVTRQAMTAT